MILSMANIWINMIKPRGLTAKWLIFLTLVGIAALGGTGYFDIVREYLDTERFTLKVGTYEISAYRVLSSLVVVAIVFWVTAIISEFAVGRIAKLKKVRAGNRILVQKIVNIGIYIVAFLFVLDFVGIDLTTLTVFSGAVGIGLGFGLQKITSNFISGLILLMEKSVEQDDLVELADGTFGFVRKSRARYTLIETFDSKEILVPNEDLITSRVINWTYSNSKARVEIVVGVSYNSDIEKAYELILEAAKEHPRCIDEPEARCYLLNYGDSSVDFTLHFWIDDVTQGRWVPKTDVMFAIWRKFKEHDIEIPFPQRDLHIKSPDVLRFNQSEEIAPPKTKKPKTKTKA